MRASTSWSKDYPVLGMSFKGNLEPTLVSLQKRLQVLDDDSLILEIQRMPLLLALSMETNVEPKLEWLGQRLVLDDKSFSLVIQRLPSIFGYNIETNLEPRIKFCEKCVGSRATRTRCKNP